jgi:hypothetical protein
MAKPAKGRALKVYWAEIDGLHDWVVAAPNRTEALAAFGVRQDLFAQGEAGETADPAAIEAARDAPLTPLRRPKGSAEPYAAATGFSDWSAAIPDEPSPRPAPRRSGAKVAPPAPRPDRRPLDRAEAALQAVETRHEEALRRLAEARAELDERQAREDARYAEDGAEARKALREAERAWREAGGD